MKQKVKNPTPVTKEEVTDIIKKELLSYPKKDDLKERLTASQNALRNEMKYEFSLMREELNQKLSQFTSRILTAIDPLLQELKTRQQEREVVAGQIRRVESNVDDLTKKGNQTRT